MFVSSLILLCRINTNGTSYVSSIFLNDCVHIWHYRVSIRTSPSYIHTGGILFVRNARGQEVSTLKFDFNFFSCFLKNKN